MATTPRTTGYDDDGLQNLTYTDKLREAEAVQHNLIIRMGSVRSVGGNTTSLQRDFEAISKYIDYLNSRIELEATHAFQWQFIQQETPWGNGAFGNGGGL